MDEYCGQVRQRFAEGGLSALRTDDAARRHVMQCTLCFDALAALSREATPEPAAPQASPEAESARFVRSLRVRSGRVTPMLIGAAALAMAAVGAWTVLAPRRGSPFRLASSASTASPVGDQEAGDGKRHRDEEGRPDERKTGNRFGIEGPADNQDAHMSREAALEAAAKAGIVGRLNQPTAPAGTTPYGRSSALGNDAMSALGALMGDQVGSNFGFGGLGLRGLGARGSGSNEQHTHGEHKPKDEHTHEADWPQWKKSDPARQLPHATPLAAARVRSHLEQPQAVAGTGTADQPSKTQTDAASLLLAHYSALEGLRFIDAHGYFANTYVPGDPELRSLQARLRAHDRASLLPQSLRASRLDDSSQRVAQPFDAPGQAALAVYVSASERGVTSSRRMLLQVGLQATPRYSGRRPAMNVGIVLDAREPLDAATHVNVRALLTAFADARDPSDKLELFVAGPGGGKLVAADAFRYGPLSVALQRVQSERSGVVVSLPDALQTVLQSVRGADDPNAPLGSSVAILIAPRALGAELPQLEALVHDSAASGVPVSVFGAGLGANPEELSQLALAGQGNRRSIDTAQDAAQAVDRELSAVARVVARAVRLRIRLASGVRLVGVLGSHPLDEVHAERVRDAENSIDQRLRRNLGIEQDRGEDEEGVQIVIPSFYAGDSHVVLLDVVAEGPGPIADVNVRYKDLFQLRNGGARESLWLPNLELARGPLQRNVLKNLVAYELAGRLRSAGDALASGGQSPALRELVPVLALLDSMGTAVPELRGDRELEQDRALAAEYLALIPHLEGAPQRQFAADSLRFASLLKLQPRPE